MDNLGKHLHDIEVKLGGGDVPPYDEEDKLGWHLDTIEELLGGGITGEDPRLPDFVSGDIGKVPAIKSDLSGFDYKEKADLVDGKVPAEQLPSFVDDVIEVASYSNLPQTGEAGKIYVTLNTGYTYRWSGSKYVQIGGQDLSNYVTLDGAQTITGFKTCDDVEILNRIWGTNYTSISVEEMQHLKEIQVEGGLFDFDPRPLSEINFIHNGWIQNQIYSPNLIFYNSSLWLNNAEPDSYLDYLFHKSGFGVNLGEEIEQLELLITGLMTSGYYEHRVGTNEEKVPMNIIASADGLIVSAAGDYVILPKKLVTLDMGLKDYVSATFGNSKLDIPNLGTTGEFEVECTVEEDVDIPGDWNVVLKFRKVDEPTLTSTGIYIGDSEE